jgi:GT2 family glycosyltransferase
MTVSIERPVRLQADPGPAVGQMRIAVVVATLGRPTEVGQLLAALQIQTHPPSAILLSVTADTDLPPALAPSVQVVKGAKGLTAQRNRGLALVLDSCDIVVFFDDDYVPSQRALEGIAALFSAHPDIAGADGHLLADGIGSAGVSYDEALTLIEAYDAKEEQAPRIKGDACGLYGCNMAFRSTAIAETRFDENLPLYGWQEDIDFAARLLPRGRLVKTYGFAGVHRGVKGARTSGIKFGYSQIINPLYLVGKKTMSAPYAARLILRNIGLNHIRLLRPEPWVDRWGRVRGNWLGLWHVLTGRIDPRLVLELP